MFKNAYARLLGLLPQRPLLVGTVVGVDNGVATIELPGGGTDHARGDVSVGQHVFFRDGNVESVTAALTDVEYDI